MKIVAGTKSITVEIVVHRDGSLAEHLEAFRLALIAQSFSYVKSLKATTGTIELTDQDNEVCNEDYLT